MDIGRGIMEIAMGLLAIAMIALLVNRAKDTSQVISSAAGGFNSLLRTVTLQNGLPAYQG